MARDDDIAELLSISSDCDEILARIQDSEIKGALDALDRASSQIHRAWSGSNLGYHANVYYRGLSPKPADSVFSREWGLKDLWPTHQPDPGWEIMDEDTVKQALLSTAGNPDLAALSEFASGVRSKLNALEAATTSILSAALSEHGNDTYLQGRLDRAEKLDVPHLEVIRQKLLPEQAFSRDSLAIGQGFKVAPHQYVAAHTMEIRALEIGVETIRNIARESAQHLRRLQPEEKMKSGKVSRTVFIGHGQSPVWRELKDFLHDRLRFSVDEFNRVATAGVPTATRLAEMLASADFAFMVMTAEDEQPDGTVRARENVVHEAGLFQGKLGFHKAIIVLEKGCVEFSNIHGLGQIRFPKGQISACFEEIRAVLEREGVI